MPSRPARLAAPLAFAIAIAGAPACTSETPSVTLAPDPGLAARPASVHGASPCGTCVAKKCSSARQACAAEASCATYLACADACPSAATGNVDASCEGACSRPRDPGGQKALAAFTACRTTGDGASCKECGPESVTYRTPLLNQACPAPPPPQPSRELCPGDVPEVLDTCFDCSWKKCCETRVTCANSAECTAYRTCLLQCGDFEKISEQCGVEHPAGLEQVAPFFACMGVLCIDPCLNPGTVVDPCVRCAVTRCGDEDAAFSSTNDGVQLRKCIAKCETGDATCSNACDAKYPSVVKQSTELYLCIDARCSFECGGE